MTETTWKPLRQLLTERYEEFLARLSRRLGSDEVARETLHETWLHLHGKDDAAPVSSPTGYLLRTAVNLATDRKRKNARKTDRFEVGILLDIADEAPGPDREVEARQQIQFLEEVLNELTPRRRSILLASRLEGIPLEQIARHLGLSQRFVETELKAALEHCAKRFDKKLVRRFGPRSRGASS